MQLIPTPWKAKLKAGSKFFISVKQEIGFGNMTAHVTVAYAAFKLPEEVKVDAIAAAKVRNIFDYTGYALVGAFGTARLAVKTDCALHTLPVVSEEDKQCLQDDGRAIGLKRMKFMSTRRVVPGDSFILRLKHEGCQFKHEFEIGSPMSISEVTSFTMRDALGFSHALFCVIGGGESSPKKRATKQYLEA